jgi:hypothetical protein
MEEVAMTQRDPRLRYKIEERADSLLDRAVKATQGAEDSDLKPGQVKALLRQVQSGYGVEHVRNWLRYQTARVGEWRESGLLDAIMDDIDELEADAKTLTKTLYPERAEEQEGQVWLAMVERYTVYLHYRFAALKKGESDE